MSKRNHRNKARVNSWAQRQQWLAEEDILDCSVLTEDEDPPIRTERTDAQCKPALTLEQELLIEAEQEFDASTDTEVSPQPTSSPLRRTEELAPEEEIMFASAMRSDGSSVSAMTERVPADLPPVAPATTAELIEDLRAAGTQASYLPSIGSNDNDTTSSYNPWPINLQPLYDSMHDFYVYNETCEEKNPRATEPESAGVTFVSGQAGLTQEANLENVPLQQFGIFPESASESMCLLPQQGPMRCSNRGSLANMLRPFFIQCASFDLSMALIVVEVANYEMIAARIGEAEGLDLVWHVALAIDHAFSQRAVVVHLEKKFLVLFLPRADQVTAAKMCQRIKESIHRLIFLRKGPRLDCMPELDFGVSDCTTNSMKFEELIDHAIKNVDAASRLGDGAVIRTIDKSSSEGIRPLEHFTPGDLRLSVARLKTGAAAALKSSNESGKSTPRPAVSRHFDDEPEVIRKKKHFTPSEYWLSMLRGQDAVQGKN